MTVITSTTPDTTIQATGPGADVNTGAANASTTTRSLVDPMDAVRLLESMNKNYIDKWSSAMQTLTEFMTEFSKLMTAISKGTTANSEPNFVNFDPREADAQLNALIEKTWAKPLVVASTPGEQGRLEAEQWQKEFGSGFVSIVGRTDDNTPIYGVLIDPAPLNTMKSALKSGKIDTASYQAMTTALDAQKQVMQNVVQIFSEKISKANGVYDSLMKTASATQAELKQLNDKLLSFI